MRVPRPVPLVALVVLCGPAVACSTANREATPERSAAPEGVTLHVHQYRSDEVNRTLAVRVSNTSARPVTVESLEVVAPGFAGPGRVELGATIGAERAYDLRVPLGRPVCDGAQAAGALVVRTEFGGYAAAVDVVPSAGGDLLDRLRDDMCALEAALEALPMRWSARWRAVPDGVRGVLEVGPARTGGDGAVEVVGLAATTLVNPVRVRVPRTLEHGESARIPVVFAPTRCDPHAFADSKKGFEVPVRVGLAGGLATTVPVVPPTAAQEQVLARLLTLCDL